MGKSPYGNFMNYGVRLGAVIFERGIGISRRKIDEFVNC